MVWAEMLPALPAIRAAKREKEQKSSIEFFIPELLGCRVLNPVIKGPFLAFELMMAGAASAAMLLHFIGTLSSAL